MIRLRLDFAYDGTDFHGWARQPGLRTVQGVLEDELARVLRSQAPPRLTVAGRTDTGVHASHQVAHLDLDPTTLEQAVGHLNLPAPQALEYRLRRLLPPDIVLRSLLVAPEGFDARFSALERTYVYRLCDRPAAADPRTRRFVLSVPDPLDDSLLNQAAALIVGLRDFGSFASPNPGGTTIRQVKAAFWRRLGAAVPARLPAHPEAAPGSAGRRIAEPLGEEGRWAPIPVGQPPIGLDRPLEPVSLGTLEFVIVADAFAHNMVRSLVGAQVQVGSGRKSLDWFSDKLARPVREGASGPIAPCGLSLEAVAYPPDGELAARAAAIRAKRVLE